MDRRGFLKTTAATGTVMLTEWPLRLFADAASDAESDIAGQLVSWTGNKIGNEIGSLAINAALSYLGLDPGGNTQGTLNEINAKLDQVLSDLDQLSIKVDQIAQSINQLADSVDIGLKQAYASISDAQLVAPFGWIGTRFGTRSTATTSNLYGLLHLPPSGQSGVATAGGSFVQQRQQFLDKIHDIHYILTVQAGSSECLLQKWATLLVARLHVRGSGISVAGYAQIYEAWFTQAISYQIKAYLMLQFANGNNAELKRTSRADMHSILQDECSKYLDGLDRLVLSAVRCGPSGPQAHPLSDAIWAPGTQDWLLRGDVFARALVTSFDGDTQTSQAKKLSGVYGRVVLRPSDLTVDGKAPDRPAFAEYPGIIGYWPQTKVTGEATLGALTEFQAIDWIQTNDAFARLKSAPNSCLRFGRYFWATPAHVTDWERDFEPFGYLTNHWTDRPFGASGEILAATVRPQGRLHVPTYRQDAKIMLFSVPNLAPVALSRGSEIRFRFVNGLPVSINSPDPFIIYGKPSAFIINFLDGWSSTANGPLYSAASPQGQQTVPMTGNSYFSWSDLNVTVPQTHLLSYDAGAIRTMVQTRSDLPTAAPCLTLKVNIGCAWRTGPGDGSPDQNASGTYTLPLFMTAADESGIVQVFYSGKLATTQLAGVDGMSLNTRIHLVVSNDKGDVYELASIDFGDFMGGQFLLGPTSGNPLPLRPNSRYTLSIRVEPRAHFSYSRHVVGHLALMQANFPQPGEARQQVELTLNSFTLYRPVGSGYQSA